MKKLRKFYPLLVIVVLLFSESYKASSQTIENSTLWEISGNNTKKTSYLFGTVHILDSAYFSLNNAVKDKITASDIMVFEVNTSDPGYQQKALGLSYMKNDSLENILTQDEYQEVQEFIQTEFGFPLSAIHKMKPFYVASVINALSLPKNSMSYEAELQSLAMEKEMDIAGISTLEKESEILDQIDMKTQKESLFDAIEEHKKGYPQREKIFQAYCRHDINSIYKLMRKDFSVADSIVYDIMFLKRNEAWLPSMYELMHEHSCFFALGVGHLPGEAGLINLLRQEGYKVRPVNMSFQTK